MTGQHINEQVNIYQRPIIDEMHKADMNIGITIGDLHGNAIKLIFLLVKHGIVTNMSTKDYNRLVEIYNTDVDSLTKEDLDEFNQIVQGMDINNKATIRLIGDELGDRGLGDHYTLMVLNKLHQAKTPLEILYSNHGGAFIDYSEMDATALENINFAEDFSLGDPQQMESLINMHKLISKGLVSREKIMNSADKAYKPALKALSYSLSEDGKEISIYSHAPIGMNNIEELTKQFNTEYKGTTAIELAETIDAINEKFQEAVKSKRVQQASSPNSELYNLAWNTQTGSLVRPKTLTAEGDMIKFVHGHCGGRPLDSHIINLDNNLGKKMRNGQHCNEGEYTVIYSSEHSLNEANKLKLLRNKCETYKNYLSKEIVKLANTLPNDLLQHYRNNHEELDINMISTQIKSGKSLDCTSQGIGIGEKHSSECYPKFYAAVHKYNVVNDMIHALSAKNPIDNMVKIMTDNKKILTDHRSSSGARFFQDILNILSFGLYSKYTKGTFAFWKSRGEVLTDNLDETLLNNPSKKIVL